MNEHILELVADAKQQAATSGCRHYVLRDADGVVFVAKYNDDCLEVVAQCEWFGVCEVYE